MSETVADVLLARLRDWGVEQVFGYPGDGINGLLAAWGRADNNPQFVQARHEEMAAFEAVGFAKFSGGVGRLRGDQRAGRDAPAQRPVRREARPRAGGGDRRADRALGDGRVLPAGGRPAQPVQGRLQRLRADVHRARAAAEPDRPGDPDRAGRAAPRPASSSPPTCSSWSTTPPGHAFKQVPSSLGHGRAAVSRTTTPCARPPTCSTPAARSRCWSGRAPAAASRS